MGLSRSLGLSQTPGVPAQGFCVAHPACARSHAWYGRTHGVDFTSALAAVRRKRDALSPGREQADVARAWLHAREPS